MTIDNDKKVYAAMTRAAQQLESAVREQEVAVNRILGLCEVLHSKLSDRGSKLQVEAIIEACAFQDITGQRISKVERLIRYLRDGGLATTYTPREPAPEVGQGALSQTQIDQLLTGGKPILTRK